MEKERGSGLLYLTIAQDMLSKIRRAEWQPGEQIPGVRDLASAYETSVKTVNSALKELDNRGLLERIQGRGIFLLPRDRWPREEGISPFICFTPAGGNPVNHSLVTALAEEVSRVGGELIIHPYRSLGREEIASRLPQPCRGVLAVDFAPPPEFFSALSEAAPRLPLLYVGGFPPPVGFTGSYLAWDLEGGLEEIVGYLMNKGHERIGYLGGALPLDRDPGFLTLRREFHRQGLAVERAYCAAPGGYGSDHGRRALEEMLKVAEAGDSPSLPTAFISLYDGVAAGAMAAAERAGREIPGDIAFVGCENSEVARTIRPGLTALSLERESAAVLAGKLLELLEQGRAGKRSPLGVKIPLVLEERGSSLAAEGGFADRWL